MSSGVETVGRTRPVRQLAEPAHFWIAYTPRTWRLCSEPWTDVANARLGGFRPRPEGLGLPRLEAEDVDDLLYLPPVDPPLAEARDALAVSLGEAGVPVLVQLRPGEDTGAEDAQRLYDLLGPLLDGELERLLALPSGSTAVWPLIPGLTDHPETCEEACELLARAGVRCVQPQVVELTSQLRRRLAESRDDDVFDALFHGRPPSEQAFAVEAAARGLEVFARRPPTGHSRRRASNRRIAAHLALAAEVWLRLGKPVGIGQGLFRAARGAEATQHDLAALARENNLEVMNWLDVHSLGLAKEVAATGRSSELDELLDAYVHGVVEGTDEAAEDDDAGEEE